MKSREPNKFKPGDIIRVVRGESKNWIITDPVRVAGYRYDSGVAIDVVTLNGAHAGRNGYGSFCLTGDCELDVFLNAAHRAVKDA